jgi:DNA-binding response OmpR family regulator
MRRYAPGEKKQEFICMKKLLVIDDEASIVTAFVRYFSKRGYHVRGLTEPEKALSLIKNGSFDVLITDFQMDSISGYEIVAYTRLGRPQTLIIGISGGIAQKDVTGIDLDYFFEKPFRLKDIGNTIDNLIRTR